MLRVSSAFSFIGRDDKTRTCDLAPPRRVRYQLRYIPLRICDCKGRLFFCNSQIKQEKNLLNYFCFLYQARNKQRITSVQQPPKRLAHNDGKWNPSGAIRM